MVTTMDVQQRIAQFENMVRPGADPDNDMAWFSLGSAYADAGRHADAARAFERCIQLNGEFSKAYQLAGQAYLSAGQPEAAARVLEQGYRVAARRGDRLPLKAIAELLAALGRPLPEVSGTSASGVVGVAGQSAQGQFICRRTGRPGTRMARPPFRGPIGQWIQQNISQETFDEWVRQGTKVINELRLDLSREEDEAVYDAHMREFLGIDEELYEQLTGRRPETPG